MREQIIPGPFSSPAKNGLGTRLEIFLHIVYSSYTCGKFLAHFESVGSFLGELLETGHPVLTCMLFGLYSHGQAHLLYMKSALLYLNGIIGKVGCGRSLLCDSISHILSGVWTSASHYITDLLILHWDCALRLINNTK